MPFLKTRRVAWCERRIESCKRDGWRRAIYAPEAKRIAEAHYRGEWRNDRRQGKGTGVNSRGWMYEGDWLEDRRHGYGVLGKISADGSVRKVYAGNWLRGGRDGHGSNWYKDGSYYEGAFRDNKRNGYGRIWYECGGYYQGEWLNDRYHGEGLFVQENGNRYVGQFANGRKEGRGVYYHTDSNRLQEGRWENDVCVNSTIEGIDCRRLAPFRIPRINGPDLPRSSLLRVTSCSCLLHLPASIWA